MDLPDSSDPTRPIRSDAIYISYENQRALRLVALKTGASSRDHVADVVISEWLEKNHKDCVDHVQRQEANEKLFRDSITPRKPL